MNTTFTLSPVAKAIVAGLATLINFAAGLLSDGQWQVEDTGNLILFAATTAGVYLVPNTRKVSEPKYVNGVGTATDGTGSTYGG